MLDVQEPIIRTSEVHLRPLNPARDLLQVADLIEICFAQTMDPDGRDYLRQMRQAGRDESFLRWAPSYPEATPMSMGGFVWENNGVIVGNLSLIPMVKGTQRVYLIANVATHPDFRRQGIAHALTQAAIDYSRTRGGASTCLQVREENQAALKLYQSLGFVERARRTTWINDQRSPIPAAETACRIMPRRAEDWSQQTSWLRELYPRDVTWNLPIHPSRFRPGLLNSLTRFLFNERIEHWAAVSDRDLVGILTWEPTHSYADNLWLAAAPTGEDAAIRCLLPVIRRLVQSRRPLSLNYPARRGEEAFRASGFTDTQTLIWMDRFENTRQASSL